jgi:hypothetical protein
MYSKQFDCASFLLQYIKYETPYFPVIVWGHWLQPVMLFLFVVLASVAKRELMVTSA